VHAVELNFASDNGVVLFVKGKKPRDFTFQQARLFFEGKDFWQTLSTLVNNKILSTFKFAFYPIVLCPTFLDNKETKPNTTDISLKIRLPNEVSFFGYQRTISKETLVKYKTT
jgi:hypothetical protein